MVAAAFCELAAEFSFCSKKSNSEKSKMYHERSGIYSKQGVSLWSKKHTYVEFAQ